MAEGVDMMHAGLRPEQPGRRRRDAFTVIGNILYCGLFGVLLVISLTLAVGTATSATERSYWGTFTQHSCESSFRGRCEGVGTWVTDNGSIVKKNIQLDGDANSDGSVRALYTPTGFNNDAENNIVHTSAWAWARFWMPWVMCVLFGGLILFRLRLIRRKRHPKASHLGSAGDEQSKIA